MQQLEIEVKFYISDLPGIRNIILSTGGDSSGRALEINIRFDDRQNSLFKRGALLRLRKIAGKNFLTHKTAPGNTDRSFKVFNETEIEVSEFESTAQILHSLGFQERQVYEKWRESIAIDNTHLCLDEMPFGKFLEIEGDPENIRSVADRLGLQWHQRILMNYLEIFSRLKKCLDLPFSDVTFENFKKYQIDPIEIQSHLKLILRGKS